MPDHKEPPQDPADPEPPEPPDPGDEPPDEPPDDIPPDTPPEKADVPDAAAQDAARTTLQGILAQASAAELLEAARADDRTPVERFVLLTKAREAAVASSDVDAALAAIDELDQRFVVEPFEMRVTTFTELSASAGTPSAAQAVAEFGLALFDEALAGGNREVAKQVAKANLAVARKSGDSELAKQATRQYLKVQE